MRPADRARSLEDLPFAEGDKVLLFTNSMGGTPLLELYLAHGIAERLFAERGITVVRRLVGPYITSLEMQGISLTAAETGRRTDRAVGRAGADRGPALGCDDGLRPRTWSSALRAAAEVIVAHRDELVELDRVIGDGDHGENLQRGLPDVRGRRGDPRDVRDSPARC